MVRRELENPTLVVLTIAMTLMISCSRHLALPRPDPPNPDQADSRDDLKWLLTRLGRCHLHHGSEVAPERGEDRSRCSAIAKNLIVIGDEAHRSQYGLEARLERVGARRYGYAHYIRQHGRTLLHRFHGTPIEAEDVNTPAIFGDYIDVTTSAGGEDGATVPPMRAGWRVSLNDDEKPLIDADERWSRSRPSPRRRRPRRNGRRWSRLFARRSGSRRSLPIWFNISRPASRLDGKAMAVHEPPNCVALYAEIVALRPTSTQTMMPRERSRSMTGSAS